MDDSVGLSSLDPRLVEEYRSIRDSAKAEFRVVEGVHVVHDILLERYCFIYVLMRSMEEQPLQMDMQRYNQLLGTWLKIGSDLLASYRELYNKTVVEHLFVEKVTNIITEEVTDPEVLARIRTRFKNLGSED